MSYSEIVIFNVWFRFVILVFSLYVSRYAYYHIFSSR
nr:MAG TPA: hypothetical protein [Caudoviricetes sp.]